MILPGNPHLAEWIKLRGGGWYPPAESTLIGDWDPEKEEWRAGLAFYSATPALNAWANIAVEPGVYPRPLLRAGLWYAFSQLGLRRLTFAIRSDNIRSIRLVSNLLGATHEATLQGIDPGCDTLFFQLSPNPKVRRVYGQERQRSVGAGLQQADPPPNGGGSSEV